MADRQRLSILHCILSVVNIALGVQAGVFQYEVPVYKAPYVVNPPVKILPYVSDISSHFQQPLFIKSFQPAPYLYHNLQPLVYTSPLPFHLPLYNQPSQQNYQQPNFGGYGGGGGGGGYQTQVQNHQGPSQIEDSYSPNYRGGDNGYNNYDNNNNFNNQGGGYNSPSNNYNFQPNQNQYNNNNNLINNNINPYEEPSNSRHRLNYPNPNQNQNQYAGAGFGGSQNVNSNSNNNHLNTDSAYNNNGFLQGISTSSRPPISANVDGFEQQSPEIFEGNNFAQSFDGSEISEPFDPSTNTFDYSNFGPSGGFGDATPTAGTGTGTGTGTGPSSSQTSSFSPNFGEYGPVSASGQTLGLGGFPLSSPSNTASVVEKFESSGESSKNGVGTGTGSERVEKVSPAPPKSNALKQSTPTATSPVKKSAPSGGGYSSLSSSEEDTVSIESTEDEKGNKYKNKKESISSTQTEQRNAEAKTQSRSTSQLSGYGNDKNISNNNNLRSTGGKSTTTTSSGRAISSGNGLRKPVSLVFGQRITPFIRASANTNTSRISNRSLLKMYVPLTRKI